MEKHFKDFVVNYKENYTAEYSKYCIERIKDAALFYQFVPDP